MPRLVANDIATALKKRIDAGEWLENGRMPPERDLADEFGVARNTVRRAVGLLEQNGTVVRQVGRGTFLAAANANIAVPAAVDPHGGHQPGRHDGDPPIAGAGGGGLCRDQCQRRRARMRSGKRIRRPARRSKCLTFEHWDAEFHHRIFACSRNEFLKEIHNLMRILRNQSPWFEMKKRTFSEERRLTYCGEHQAILDALVSRDPEGARQAMLGHLQTVERNLLGR